MTVIDQVITDTWALYCGDAVEVIQGIPDSSVGYSIFSPPFASLFTYSNSQRDMGNSKGQGEFLEHFRFLVRELLRVLMPGRSVSFHCMNLPATITSDGYIGIHDFRGDLIRLFQAAGFIFHSEHVIWKDPLVQAVRTHTLTLAHQQIVKDSSRCSAGLPDYLVTMRKPGDNPEPVKHPEGFTSWVGEPEEEPREQGVKYSHHVWRKYASPVWMDIDQTNTLNTKLAKEQEDERHICPLQLDVIARGLELWSNEGDVILSPFAGIGSEGYVAVERGRRFLGIELKKTYFDIAVRNLQRLKSKAKQEVLFA